MDIQLKRGLLDICVLAALKNGDSYGYRIINDVAPYISISESTLYPILRRLEEAKFIEGYSVEHNGRLRKYFKITDSGRMRIKFFLDEWSEIVSVYNFISKEENTNVEE